MYLLFLFCTYIFAKFFFLPVSQIKLYICERIGEVIRRTEKRGS